MTLTPQQRIEAYRYVIAHYEGSTALHSGMCIVLYNYANYRLEKAVHNIGVFDVFTELALLQPPNSGAYWFPCTEEGKQQRIELLHKAIELAEKAEV